MQIFKVVMLVIVALLLLVQLLDRSRETLQLAELHDTLEQSQIEFQRLRSDQRQMVAGQQELSESMRALSSSLNAFSQGLQSGQLQTPQDGKDGEQAAAMPGQADGLPVEGENFLLPYDRSAFDPDKVGGTFQRFAAEPTQGLNTLLTSMGSTSDIVNMVSDSLAETRPEDPTRWHQSLATAVHIEEGFTRFTFTLRQGVTWHVPQLAREEGKEWLRQPVELTAHDFVFFLDMVNNPEVNAPHLRAYYAGARARAIDDYTLEVTWEESEYTNITFTLGMSPLPRHIYTNDEFGEPLGEEDIPVVFNEHWFDRAWGLIGTGPYVMHRFEPRSHVEFRRNPDYWGVTQHFERQRWNLRTRQPDAQLLGFKNNEVHMYSPIPSQWKGEVIDGHEPRFAAYDPDGDTQAGRESPFGWEIVGGNSWSGLCWNTRRSRLSDPRVRQALAHAFDFERVRDEVYFGLAQRSTGPIHPTSPYFNADTPAYTFDLERAAQLLDEAGWVDSNGDGWRDKVIDGERVTLRINITYYALNRVWANLISLYADDCRKIGVRIDGDPVEDEEWGRRADNRDFDAFAVGWRSGLQVDFMQLWHSSGANEPRSSNYASYVNPEADVHMEALRNTFDVEERYRLGALVADYIYRDQPYLFVSVARGAFFWHNSPYRDTPDRRERLGGVIHGFDHYHPLFPTDRSRWFMVRE